MSANVTNGKPATDVNVLCGYNPTNAATAANLALNQANMRYFAEANCPAEIKKQLLNWMLSAFYEVIDRGDVGVSTMGSCDSISFYQAIINLIAPCHWPLRTTAINSNTHLLAQDCPSGALQRISAQSLSVPCRSQLSLAPADGNPHMWIDDAVNPAVVYYWDCGQEVYRKLEPDVATQGFVCLSELTSPPSGGVPRLYLDDSVSPARITYWDCGLNAYFQVVVPTTSPLTTIAAFRSSLVEGTLVVPSPEVALGGTASYMLGSNTTSAPNPSYLFTFSSPQPDTNYQVVGTFLKYDNTMSSAIGVSQNLFANVVKNSNIIKTVSGFTLNASGLMTNVVGGMGSYWFPEFDIQVLR